jgi:CDGSH iron-sulfur domain-containing protein 3
MSEPHIGGRAPIPVEVEAGKSYWWCACGLSKSQPFCDGSHKVTNFTPVEFKAEKNEKVFFCTCKRSSRKPACDGSHKKLLPP